MFHNTNTASTISKGRDTIRTSTTMEVTAVNTNSMVMATKVMDTIKTNTTGLVIMTKESSAKLTSQRPKKL